MAEEINNVLDVDIAKDLRKLRFALRFNDLLVVARKASVQVAVATTISLESDVRHVSLVQVFVCNRTAASYGNQRRERASSRHIGHPCAGAEDCMGYDFLLREGLADEAYARSRTIDELWITAEFLEEYSTAALPYCLHDVVDNHDAVKRFPGHWQDELEHKRTYDTLVKAGLIDENTHPANGWAAKALGKKAGTPVPFTKIREEVEGFKKHSPAYSQASQQVHANRVGLLGLEAPPDNSISLRGSGYGLGVPITNVTSGLVRLNLCASGVYGTFGEGEDERVFEETLITWNLGRRIWNKIVPTNPVMN